MTDWVSGLAFWQQGLVLVLTSLVLGLIAGRIIHRGNPMDEAEERRRD